MAQVAPGAEHVAKLQQNEGFRAALTRAQKLLADFAGDKWPEIQAAIESQRRRLQEAGFKTDGDWVECLDHIARIAERDPAAEFSADEIERWAIAWVDRERLKAEMNVAAGEFKRREIVGVATTAAGNTPLDAGACALKLAHPDWSNKQIAEALGCHEKSLYKPNMIAFKKAKDALKSGREKYRHGERNDRHRRPSNVDKRDPDDD